MIVMTNARLANAGIIDRGQIIEFEFNNKSYQGFSGDTLASALLANGVSLTARSFKYHRPRGILTCGVEEPCSFVELLNDSQAGNQPVTTVQIKPGLKARSVNCWPSPDFDLMAVNQVIAKLLPAAFYYKTFMWPNWHLYEPHIRRAAGLANAPDLAYQNQHYEARHGHCDVLVVGSGPAGLMAALTAARSGARVILADMQPQAGGSLLTTCPVIDRQQAIEWIRSIVEQLRQLTNVVVLQNTTVWAYREHNLLMLSERCNPPHGICLRNWRIRAKQVILATGAIERTLVFPDNDRPGIMLASAAQSYINKYAVRPGKKAVIFTNNNSAYSIIGDLNKSEIEVNGIVDSRQRIDEHCYSLASKTPVYSGYQVTKTHGTKHIKSVTIRSLLNDDQHTLDCDLLCISGGWNPTVHLHSQSRGSLKYCQRLASFVPDQAVQHSISIGGAAGVFELQNAMNTGIEAGADAVSACGYKVDLPDLPRLDCVDHDYSIEPFWHVQQPDLSAKSFIDLHNDVTLNDIHLAIREGFDAVEHTKRYTTTGMGIDQGKTGNVNAIGAIALRTGMAMDEIGTTTFRSPFTPVEFGAIAGIREQTVIFPYRHTPMTQWHKDNGATMYEAGARWRRPGYYALEGERFQDTVDRESLTVRQGVGVYDGSPLGKFEIKGPDSLKLLDMLYTNSFSSLEINQGRYGLMLSDDGLILDDGVSFKLADNHYLMSTSTGHADEVYRHIEHFLQMERPSWQVHITPVTSQWSNATICGPKARLLMQALGTDIDLSNEAFPFMALRQGQVAGFPARVCRVSFTGELSYEINVYPRYALSLWKKIIDTGQAFDIAPIGSEANHVLRVEKGFLSLGHEADGTIDAFDLGMGWIMSKTKTDFIGKRAVDIRRQSEVVRRQLVGLYIDDTNRLVTEGAPITANGDRVPSQGLVTACVHSVVHNRSIALALLTNGRKRHGEKAHIRLKGESVSAEIVSPCFYDPQGERLRS